MAKQRNDATGQGKDRISARQIIKGADFMQKSDFRGLWKEIQSKTGTTFGYVSDMVTNTITKMDIEPVKPGKHKTDDVIGQDVKAARNNLKVQQIEVNEVKPYKPRLNARSIVNITAFPVNLKPGMKVNLYEENGKVRYYTIVKEKKTDTQDKKIQVQQDGLDSLKKELDATKEQVARKDEQIAALKEEIKSMHAEQEEIKQRLAPGTITQMEKEIEMLREFRKDMEKTLKKTRKSTSK
jgi:hypothetical protein